MDAAVRRPTHQDVVGHAGLIWLAGVALPPMLVLGVGLPFIGLPLTWRSRRLSAVLFGAALAAVVLLAGAALPEGWWRDREGGTSDPGPSLCVQQAWGQGPCPDG